MGIPHHLFVPESSAEGQPPALPNGTQKTNGETGNVRGSFNFRDPQWWAVYVAALALMVALISEWKPWQSERERPRFRIENPNTSCDSTILIEAMNHTAMRQEPLNVRLDSTILPYHGILVPNRKPTRWQIRLTKDEHPSLRRDGRHWMEMGFTDTEWSEPLALYFQNSPSSASEGSTSPATSSHAVESSTNKGSSSSSGSNGSNGSGKKTEPTIHLPSEVEIIISYGGTTNENRARYAEPASHLLTKLNGHTASEIDNLEIKDFLTSAGESDLLDFLSAHKLYINKSKIENAIISYKDIFVEVRPIPVYRIPIDPTMGKTDTMFIVLGFNKETPPKLAYIIHDQIASLGYLVLGRDPIPSNSAEYARLVSFFKDFENAYNTRDTAFLSSVYADNAEIVVGRDISLLVPQSNFEFYTRNKKTYMDNLTRTFNTYRDQVWVRFDKFEFRRDPNNKNRIVAQCHQAWRAGTYHDYGKLFIYLEIDVQGQGLIIKRMWHPRIWNDAMRTYYLPGSNRP